LENKDILFSIPGKENGFFCSQNLLDPFNAPASYSFGTGASSSEVMRPRASG